MDIIFQGKIDSIAQQLLLLIAKHGDTARVIEAIVKEQNSGTE